MPCVRVQIQEEELLQQQQQRVLHQLGDTQVSSIIHQGSEQNQPLPYRS